MTKDEALRLALEALELVGIEFVCNGAHHAKKDRHEWLDTCPIVDRYKEAITAIKAALEAKDEPLAYLPPTASPDNACYIPPQRKWVGLTQMELIQCGVLPFGMSYKLCQTIEAKLKEKNT